MFRGGVLAGQVGNTTTHMFTKNSSSIVPAIRRAAAGNNSIVRRHACTNAWNSLALHRNGARAVLQQHTSGLTQRLAGRSTIITATSSRPWSLFTLGKRLKSTASTTASAGSAGAGATSGNIAVAHAGPGTLWDKAMYVPKKYPFAFQSIFAMIKTMCADAAVQIYGEGKDTTEKFDFKRNAVFAAFGFGYLGCAQWFFYVTVMHRIFPNMGRFAEQSWRAKLKDGAGIRALFGQVAFDNFVVTPVFYFPFFYCFKQSIQGDLDLSKMDFGGIGRDAYEKYCANLYDDCIAMWTLFVPGDFIIYSLPIWARLPANHGLSLLWTFILSSMRGDKIEDEDVAEEGAVVVDGTVAAVAV